jgi:hypothetical protein
VNRWDQYFGAPAEDRLSCGALRTLFGVLEAQRRRGGLAVTIRDVGRACGYSSTMVAYYLPFLKKKGLVGCDDGSHCTIRATCRMEVYR